MRIRPFLPPWSQALFQVRIHRHLDLSSHRIGSHSLMLPYCKALSHLRDRPPRIKISSRMRGSYVECTIHCSAAVSEARLAAGLDTLVLALLEEFPSLSLTSTEALLEKPCGDLIGVEVSFRYHIIHTVSFISAVAFAHLLIHFSSYCIASHCTRDGSVFEAYVRSISCYLIA